MSDCIFCKIIAGEIPSQKVYEDDFVVAFRDLYPKARVHVLVVPKQHIPTAMDFRAEDEALFGKMARAAAEIAREAGLEGYRLQVNVGEKGGQEVFHVHMHVMGD